MQKATKDEDEKGNPSGAINALENLDGLSYAVIDSLENIEEDDWVSVNRLRHLLIPLLRT